MVVNISNTTVADNVPVGTIVGVLTATQGTIVIPCTFGLAVNPNNYFAISGNNLVTAQSGSLAQGQYSVKVSATPVSLSADNTFTISVTAPPAQPVITVTPNTPDVPDTTPLGAVVATYTVTMSDGSPFSGTVRFGAPFYDGGGIFALTGKNIIVNPTGPGVGPNTATITDHITLEAI
jgi:hypothetical protein